MKLRWPFHILILTIVVFSIYFPSLNAEISLVDDKDAVTSIHNAETFAIKDIFFPRVKDGGYYRPLVGVAYYLDKSFWDMNTRSMHLDNIIMHLLNVILVYFLTVVVFKDNDQNISNRLLPLTSALFFALHPVNTESVNWISGRTDPMAANFVILAAILVVLYRKTSNKIHIISSIVLVLLGVLAKETSLGMVLAGGLILYAHKSDNKDVSLRDCDRRKEFVVFSVFYSLIVVEVLYFGNYWLVITGVFLYAVYLLKPWRNFQSGNSLLLSQFFKFAGIFVISSSMAILIYTILRKIAFSSDVSKISHTVKLMLDDTNYALSLFLGASGFYVKKFFLPLPLNFFILEIDPLYDLAGVAVLLFCVYLLTRLTLTSALFLSGVCMFIPALPFAFGTIAWTGYAERYIYLSSAFWIVSIMIYLDSLSQQYKLIEKLCIVVLPILIFWGGWQTFSRNIVWQKNVTLLADTVEKSPKQPVLREMYMQALVNAGQYQLAKDQYAIGRSRSLFHSEGPDLILAQIWLQEGKLNDALAIYEKAVKKSNYKSERALKSAVDLINRMIATERSDKSTLMKKKSYYETLLLKISKDPMLFYNMGQKNIGTGDRKAAIACFEKAQSLFSEENQYRSFSSKIITRLKNETK